MRRLPLPGFFACGLATVTVLIGQPPPFLGVLWAARGQLGADALLLAAQAPDAYGLVRR